MCIKLNYKGANMNAIILCNRITAQTFLFAKDDEDRIGRHAFGSQLLCCSW